MKMGINLIEELKLYLKDLPDYVAALKVQYLFLPDSEKAAKMAFLESFERKMREGLELLLEKTEYHKILEKIRNPSKELLKENKKRYMEAIVKDKGEVEASRLHALMEKLRQSPLLHATKDKKVILREGILTPANLWKNRIKTSANAMDLALGLHFHCVFFTHGFILEEMSDDFIAVSSELLKGAIVSSVDVFKIVLMKNNLENKSIIHTEKWFVALEDYSKQLFAGEDFLELKAAYILAYFDGNVEIFNEFARGNFYSKDLVSVPDGEYAFLGEVKVVGNILKEKIISE